jgi:hypothetical protein
VTPRLRRQERTVVTVAITVMVAAATVVGVTSLHRARVAFDSEHAHSFAVGDCVVVPSDALNHVEARKASCTEDPSYVIGATVAAGDECPTPEYQRFDRDVADETTAGLCLVPNLLAEHCYLMQLPFGALQRADCATAEPNPAGGVLVQVNERHDVHDRKVCPDVGNHFVWPYPSPERTYCTETIV